MDQKLARFTVHLPLTYISYSIFFSQTEFRLSFQRISNAGERDPKALTCAKGKSSPLYYKRIDGSFKSLLHSKVAAICHKEPPNVLSEICIFT